MNFYDEVFTDYIIIIIIIQIGFAKFMRRNPDWLLTTIFSHVVIVVASSSSPNSLSSSSSSSRRTWTWVLTSPSAVVHTFIRSCIWLYAQLAKWYMIWHWTRPSYSTNTSCVIAWIWPFSHFTTGAFRTNRSTNFLDASSHHYKMVCLSVRPSIHPLRLCKNCISGCPASNQLQFWVCPECPAI